MKCPKCNGKSTCLDSRDRSDGARTHRYVCLVCDERFSTTEQIATRQQGKLKYYATESIQQKYEELIGKLRELIEESA